MFTGIIEGQGRIAELTRTAKGARIGVETPFGLKDDAIGDSIAVNGVSLTVNEVDGDTFGINVIPHTQAVTTWGAVKVGDRINLEVDTLARYVARLNEVA